MFPQRHPAGYDRRMDGPSDWQRYTWADHDEDLLDSCLGVVVGQLSEAEVLAAYRIDPASRWDMSIAEFMELPTPAGEVINDFAQAWRDGERVVVRELWRFDGMRPEFAAALSRGGRFASFTWNGDGDMEFVYAVDGELRRSFDPLLYEAAATLPEEADLPFPDEDTEYLDDDPLYAMSSAMTLLERLTGVRFDDAHALYDLPRPTYRRLPAGS